MNFKQFLLQEEQSDKIKQATEELLKSVAAQIKSECSDWLNKSKGEFVWRGTRTNGEIIDSMSEKNIARIMGIENSSSDINIQLSGELSDIIETPALIIATRTDRKPKDSLLKNHNRLNSALEKAFGIKYRSEAVFTTPDATTAEEYYSRVFAVFPRGECNFIWSDMIYDAYSIKDEANLFRGVISSRAPDNVKRKFFKMLRESILKTIPSLSEATKEILENAKVQDDVREAFLMAKRTVFDSADAASKSYEKRIQEDAFTLADEDNVKKVLDYLLDNFAKDLYYHNKPIDESIPSEVMIACKDYIAVPLTWAIKLKKYL